MKPWVSIKRGSPQRRALDASAGALKRRVAALLLVLAALLLVLDIPAFAQCAMCQGATAAGSDGGAVYNRSTLFMLCVPYLLLGGVAGYVVYAFRRVRPANPSRDPITAAPAPSQALEELEREQG
jgi:hypothetical protein